MLKLTNISKSFKKLKVLKELSFSIEKDEALAIIGPSGCGKSTLLNLICDFLKQDSGLIINDFEKLACIFQDDRLLPFKSVYKNIAIVRKQEDKSSIERLLEETKLSAFKDFLPSQISGGMKKRCALARAFYYDASLLLMDEPFNGLDFPLRVEMLKLTQEMYAKSGASLLFITHEVDEALFIADRIILLSKAPAKVVKEFILPPKKSRDLNSKKIALIKAEIISKIINI